MRLLYEYTVRTFTKNICQLVIDDLKGRVATSFDIGGKSTSWKVWKINTLFKFLTTSRPVEAWLQKVEGNILTMKQKKIPVEMWIVTGGYGAGKSHMKEFLRRSEVNTIKFLELKITPIQSTDENSTFFYDVFSLILLQTKPLLFSLYGAIKKEQTIKANGNIEDAIRKTILGYSLDDVFINAFYDYAKSGNRMGSNFYKLEELIIKRGEQLFLPLMKLYKNYLNINGLCIFIDEFESLQRSIEDEQLSEGQIRFVKSLREFYDVAASTRANNSLPSFMMIILCTLSFWNELTSDTRSQALETRIRLFEIPPLVEDEIISIAEKIYAIYKKAGYPSPDIHIDFKKLPTFLLQKAGIEAPLTPRFVINEIIHIIEDPIEYIGFVPQSM